MQQNANHPYGDKFYVWNIPITTQDLDVFELPPDPKQKQKNR